MDRQEWDALTPDEQWESISALLDLLPCPDHGRCIPYAMDRIHTLEHIYRQYWGKATHLNHTPPFPPGDCSPAHWQG
jgi:hypothetical protein